ncbi:MAG: EAL domain-containing protein [Desulfobulbaceae bacterium]|jgi:EAL domain-containing protein (putative c-di-GMP-specific phosphodiesterase class I)|nr:EAL domain-containing protein [Desulfobulbaceae bacterium]
MNLPDLNYVQPFFQPIISADDLSVFAYEVLAREVRAGKVKTLGPYFEDKTVPDLDKLVVDQHVRTLALKKFAASGSRAKLFMNLKPSWILERRGQDGDRDESQILTMVGALGLDPKNIVIEVTEEELLADIDEFSRLLADYRRMGCLLAIDDFGKGASSIERIAYVDPNIVKIDSSIVQRVDSHRSFFEICQAMAAFGDISGFDLLFEGVETPYQLERCVAARGRYFQGWIFAKAEAEPKTDFTDRDLLDSILSIRASRDMVKMRRRGEMIGKIENDVEQLRRLIPDNERELANPQALLALARELPYYCIRCFVCNMRGRQLSHVYQVGSHGVVTVGASNDASWFFRDFFTKGLGAIQDGRLGYLSEIYKNVITKENIATYIHRLSDERLLCVDVISTVLN